MVTMNAEPSPTRPFAFVLIAGLATALGLSLALKPASPAHARATQPLEHTDVSAEPSAPPSQVTPDREAAPEPLARGEAPTLAEAKAAPEAAPEAPVPPPEPLHVVGLGWELVAPGVLANDGLAPGEDSRFRAHGIDARFTVTTEVAGLEAALARGAVEGGAELAILPLPTFVASYERLRALDPEVFFVLGWSTGRDALVLEPRDWLVNTGSSKASTIRVEGEPGRASTYLALHVLDAHGDDLDRVELVQPGSTRESKPRVSARAIERSTRTANTDAVVDSRALALSSADAPQLIPFVAVAPAGVVRARGDDLARFCQLWLEGTETLAADVPKAARRIAGEAGAPEAIALLNALAYLEHADLDAAARAAGLSGRGAVSIEPLFQRSWALWRAVGVLSTPAPAHAPLDNSVLAQVALAHRASGSADAVTRAAQERRGGDRLVLVHHHGEAALERDALIDELGLLAGSFSQAHVELRVRGDRKVSRAIVDEAVERFGLDPEHIVVGPRVKGKDTAQIRVLVP
ncbi:hypothetical protein PPSIR1_07460 [Plesiocystis pacifica SIR-1]|uniref:Uncharacterized protein n=2 Tax=Plesiocystis pacifica TaxID=191768 RepID=A6GCN3_9BACT|nr:hypothetical protein PPSIR1_07460 [Plesiocystis pacifica SIR-1]